MIEQAVVATVGFEEFFSDRYRSAARFAFLLTGSGQVAEEIAQDAFLQVFRRWSEIRNPEAYLSKALVSGARSWGRRERRTASAPPYGPVEHDSDAIAVRDALWALPPVDSARPWCCGTSSGTSIERSPKQWDARWAR